jgi:transposase
MGRLTNEVKFQIVALIEANMSHAQISRQLRIGKSTVRMVLKKYVATGSVSNLPVSGRPKKLTHAAVGCSCA